MTQTTIFDEIFVDNFAGGGGAGVWFCAKGARGFLARNGWEKRKSRP